MRQSPFARNLYVNCSIVWRELDSSDTTMVFAKFQNDYATEMDVVGERDFARFRFKSCFGEVIEGVNKTLAMFMASILLTRQIVYLSHISQKLMSWEFESYEKPFHTHKFHLIIKSGCEFVFDTKSLFCCRGICKTVAWLYRYFLYFPNGSN